MTKNVVVKVVKVNGVACIGDDYTTVKPFETFLDYERMGKADMRVEIAMQLRRDGDFGLQSSNEINVIQWKKTVLKAEIEIDTKSLIQSGKFKVVEE